MNKEEFEKSKKELEKAKKQNNEQIAISYERNRISKVNNLEYKGQTTLIFTMMAYSILLFTSLGLTESLGTSTIANILSGFTYSIALIGSSIGIGTLMRTLFFKKFQTKERLKVFSTAKTQAEKLEEEVHYQIELEKANNRNKAIDQTIKILNSNQTILNIVSSRYDLNDRTASQSKEEAEQKAQKLSTIIKEQYDKLDILTTQKVLHDRFWKVRQKFQRRFETIYTSTISGTFIMAFTVLPSLIIKEIMPSSSVSAILAVPFVAGIVGSSAYMIKRNKDYKKVFNNLNAKLGENALEENLNKKFESEYEEQEKIEALIERQIRDISLAEVQLQENKRYLDTHITEEDKRKANSEQSFQNLKITEKTKEDILKHLERYTNCDVRTRMDKFYTDNESHIE